MPTAATKPAPIVGNLLKPALENVTCDGRQYILAEGTEGIGFYKAENGSTIVAGKGYLQFEGAGIKAFFFDEDATGINCMPNAIAQTTNQRIYTLAGQRLSKPLRGIMISNGKKILVK